MSLQPEALGALFEMSGSAVLGINNNNVISFANPAAAALLGAAAGKSAAGIVPQCILDDPGKQFIASVTAKGRHGHIAVSRLDDLSLLCYTLPAPERPPLLLDQAMQDMANSLMSFRMALDMVLNNTSAQDDEKLRPYTAALHKEYYRIKRIQRHLTMFSGIRQDNLPFLPQTRDLSLLCRNICDTVNYFCSDLQISLTFQALPGDYFTYMDQELVKTMLLNILSNSLAHMQSGGAISITLSRQGNRFILSVADTGGGIAPEALAAAFSGSSPTEEDLSHRVGMGLLIARGIAERHGGTLILENRPEHGVSVRISLPYREPNIPMLHSPPAYPREEAPELILTELSTVLDKKFYTSKMLD